MIDSASHTSFIDWAVVLAVPFMVFFYVRWMVDVRGRWRALLTGVLGLVSGALAVEATVMSGPYAQLVAFGAFLCAAGIVGIVWPYHPPGDDDGWDDDDPDEPDEDPPWWPSFERDLSDYQNRVLR